MAASKSHGPSESRPRARLLKLISQEADDFQESFAIVHDPRRKPWQIVRFSPEGREIGKIVQWKVISMVRDRDSPRLLSVFESRETAQKWLTEHVPGRAWSRLLAPFDPKKAAANRAEAEAAHEAFCDLARRVAPDVAPQSLEAWKRVHAAGAASAHSLEVYEEAACGCGGQYTWVERELEVPLTFGPASCLWHGTAVIQDSAGKQVWTSADETPPDPGTDTCSDLPLDVTNTATIAYTE
jgi:hypothetical protein